MVKTTVYLDAPVYQRLKQLARERGSAPAALIREAMAAYAEAQPPAKRPRSLGAFHSGRHDLSEQAEAELGGLGEI